MPSTSPRPRASSSVRPCRRRRRTARSSPRRRGSGGRVRSQSTHYRRWDTSPRPPGPTGSPSIPRRCNRRPGSSSGRTRVGQGVGLSRIEGGCRRAGDRDRNLGVRGSCRACCARGAGRSRRAGSPGRSVRSSRPGSSVRSGRTGRPRRSCGSVSARRADRSYGTGWSGRASRTVGADGAWRSERAGGPSGAGCPVGTWRALRSRRTGCAHGPGGPAAPAGPTGPCGPPGPAGRRIQAGQGIPARRALRCHLSRRLLPEHLPHPAVRAVRTDRDGSRSRGARPGGSPVSL